MASLEAKILGERAENYCSSDEGDHDEDRDHPVGPVSSEQQPSSSGGGLSFTPGPPPPSTNKWGGTSQNTGPKGVLRDWELYKEHQELLRHQQDADLIRMVKESSLSCRTDQQDQQAQQMMEDIQEQISQDKDNEDLEELLSDKVLEQFIQKRLQLMSQSSLGHQPQFGSGLVEILSGDVFLQIVDSSNPQVTVVVHIYDDQHPECSKMNECLISLSELYPRVQFCKMKAYAAGVSMTFKAKGIPALLVYKGGSLIGNFVQLKDEFGSEFYVGDVENFLIENGMIEDRTNIPTLLHSAKKAANKTNKD